MHNKFELNQIIHRLDTIVFIHMHADITIKMTQMNSGDLKKHKHVKILMLNFFMIAVLSLHSIFPESKKKKKEILGTFQRINFCV